MPSPARVHHLAPVEDISMDETEAQISEAQVSAEETSAVEQDVAQVELRSGHRAERGCR